MGSEMCIRDRSSTSPQNETASIVACTVSRDVQVFDLLIEDMENALGESWGDLGFSEALAFLDQPEAKALEFIALAINSEDEDDLVLIGEIIALAKTQNVKVILIAEDVTPTALHQLLRQGADEFVPYPLPEGELMAAVERLKKVAAPQAQPQVQAQASTGSKPQLKTGEDKQGAVLVCHGMAGGTGATTLAVNLAWELATVDKKESPSVCLLDFDMQFGTVATYLCLLYTSPSPRDLSTSRMPSSA